jgi:thiamine biosynthesis lipoprotein
MGPRRTLIRLALALLVAAPAAAAEPVTLQGRAMGTTWVARVRATLTASEQIALQAALAARLEALEAMFSTYRTDSVLSAFNAGEAGIWVPVPTEVVEVAVTSQRLSEATGGAFDATVAPLLALWGFGPAGRIDQWPDPARVEAARQRVDWRSLEVRQDAPALRQARPGTQVDFSSVAKGFAADAMHRLLAEAGHPSHLVQVGGDLRSGSAGGSPWRVGIENPDRPSEPAEVVSLTGEALSTSGNYRSQNLIAGRRIGHLIDPRSGQPAESALVAVSVIHASAAESSGWATALFVLGPVEGPALARRLGLAALFQVREASELRRTPTPVWEPMRAAALR